MSDSKSPSESVSSEWIDSTAVSLIQQVKQSDSQAWTRLVRVYSPLVASWCRAAGLSSEDTADLLQEVFRSVLTGIDRFRYDSAADTFRGWLRVITRNKLSDFFHKQQKSPQAIGGTGPQQHFLQLADSSQSELDEDSDRTETNLVFRSSLEVVRSEFEEQTWLAFWRVVVDGRSPEDVARELNTTRTAVYKAKSRVLLRLRKELGATED